MSVACVPCSLRSPQEVVRNFEEVRRGIDGWKAAVRYLEASQPCVHAVDALIVVHEGKGGDFLRVLGRVANWHGSLLLAHAVYRRRVWLASLAESPGEALAAVVQDGLCMLGTCETFLCESLREGPWPAYLAVPRHARDANWHLSQALVRGRFAFAALLLEKGVDPLGCYRCYHVCACRKFPLETLYYAFTELSLEAGGQMQEVFHMLLAKGCRPAAGEYHYGERQINLFRELADGTAEQGEWLLLPLLEVVAAPRVQWRCGLTEPLEDYARRRGGWVQDVLAARAHWTPLRAAWVAAVVRAPRRFCPRRARIECAIRAAPCSTMDEYYPVQSLASWLGCAPLVRRGWRQDALESCERGDSGPLEQLMDLMGARARHAAELAVRAAKLECEGSHKPAEAAWVRHNQAELEPLAAEDRAFQAAAVCVMNLRLAAAWGGAELPDDEVFFALCARAAQWGAPAFSPVLPPAAPAAGRLFGRLLRRGHEALAAQICLARPRPSDRAVYLDPGLWGPGPALPLEPAGREWLHRALQEAGPLVRAMRPDAWSGLEAAYGRWKEE